MGQVAESGLVQWRIGHRTTEHVDLVGAVVSSIHMTHDSMGIFPVGNTLVTLRSSFSWLWTDSFVIRV